MSLLFFNPSLFRFIITIVPHILEKQTALLWPCRRRGGGGRFSGSSYVAGANIQKYPFLDGWAKDRYLSR